MAQKPDKEKIGCVLDDGEDPLRRNLPSLLQPSSGNESSSTNAVNAFTSPRQNGEENGFNTSRQNGEDGGPDNPRQNAEGAGANSGQESSMPSQFQQVHVDNIAEWSDQPLPSEGTTTTPPPPSTTPPIISSAAPSITSINQNLQQREQEIQRQAEELRQEKEKIAAQLQELQQLKSEQRSRQEGSHPLQVPTNFQYYIPLPGMEELPSSSTDRPRYGPATNHRQQHPSTDLQYPPQRHNILPTSFNNRPPFSTSNGTTQGLHPSQYRRKRPTPAADGNAPSSLHPTANVFPPSSTQQQNPSFNLPPLFSTLQGQPFDTPSSTSPSPPIFTFNQSHTQSVNGEVQRLQPSLYHRQNPAADNNENASSSIHQNTSAFPSSSTQEQKKSTTSKGLKSLSIYDKIKCDNELASWSLVSTTQCDPVWLIHLCPQDVFFKYRSGQKARVNYPNFSSFLKENSANTTFELVAFTGAPSDNVDTSAWKSFLSTSIDVDIKGQWPATLLYPILDSCRHLQYLYFKEVNWPTMLVSDLRQHLPLHPQTLLVDSRTSVNSSFSTVFRELTSCSEERRHRYNHLLIVVTDFPETAALDNLVNNINQYVRQAAIIFVDVLPYDVHLRQLRARQFNVSSVGDFFGHSQKFLFFEKQISEICLSIALRQPLPPYEETSLSAPSPIHVEDEPITSPNLLPPSAPETTPPIAEDRRQHPPPS